MDPTPRAWSPPFGPAAIASEKLAPHSSGPNEMAIAVRLKSMPNTDQIPADDVGTAKRCSTTASIHSDHKMAIALPNRQHPTASAGPATRPARAEPISPPFPNATRNSDTPTDI